jgi:hypothetical protein
VNIITADLETYYSKTYSLSKMTTEAYIRDPRFQVIGVSVKVNDGPTTWFSGPARDTLEFLHEYDWENSALLAQNTMFDAAILSWRCGVKPAKLLDTMCMSRALHGVNSRHSLAALAERYGVGTKGDEVLRAIGKRRTDFTKDELEAYGDYCAKDTDLTWEIFNRMIDAGFPTSELALIDLTLKMFTEPVLELDVPHLVGHLERTIADKAALLVASGVTTKKDLMSNAKFAAMLEARGVTPPRKISPTTGKETYAFAKTDEDFVALQEHEDPAVQALVAARLGNKSTIEETRTQRFIDIGTRGPLPIPLRYYAAHTGRWGGCLVADTRVTVVDKTAGIVEKKIVDVLPDDLVWDGEEFVAHEGVVFSGYAETVSWDGVEGTADHVVFTDAGEISLRAAAEGGHHIQTPRHPTTHDMDAARRRAREHEIPG